MALMQLLGSCVTPKDQCTHEQGIAGRVFWLEGNFMPSPDPGPGAEKTPARRQIVVHELIKMAEIGNSGGPLFERLPGRVVSKKWTEPSGHFRICLPPGTYSVFTVEETGYFANRFNAEGHVQPVTVEKGSFTEITIDINYKAYY
jgi:hypothetical protein